MRNMSFCVKDSGPMVLHYAYRLEILVAQLADVAQLARTSSNMDKYSKVDDIVTLCEYLSIGIM